MNFTTESKNDTREFGRMIEYRVKPDHEWGCGREENLQRQRAQVVKNLILVTLNLDNAVGMTLVLTPEL